MIKEDCDKYIRDINIKTPSLWQQIQFLSGGNQQKVLVARWLLTSPDILFMDEPTRGIDIGAKTEIYKLIEKLAQSGKSIIMVSSELPEIIGLSDRIVVFHEGSVTAILERSDGFTQENIMAYATGAYKKNRSPNGLESFKPSIQNNGGLIVNTMQKNGIPVSFHSVLKIRYLVCLIINSHYYQFIKTGIFNKPQYIQYFKSNCHFRHNGHRLDLCYYFARNRLIGRFYFGFCRGCCGQFSQLPDAVGKIFPNLPMLPFPIVFFTALILGGLCGAVSGFLIAKFQIHAFIATLGMMTVARGFALIFSSGKPVSYINPVFNIIGGRLWGVIPVPVVIYAAVIAVSAVILNYTRFGKSVFAIGANSTAAEISGINVKRNYVIIYMISGLLAGLAAIVFWGVRAAPIRGQQRAMN